MVAVSAAMDPRPGLSAGRVCASWVTRVTSGPISLSVWSAGTGPVRRCRQPHRAGPGPGPRRVSQSRCHFSARRSKTPMTELASTTIATMITSAANSPDGSNCWVDVIE